MQGDLNIMIDIRFRCWDSVGSPGFRMCQLLEAISPESWSSLETLQGGSSWGFSWGSVGDL